MWGENNLSMFFCFRKKEGRGATSPNISTGYPRNMRTDRRITFVFSFVPRAGVEPARTLLSTRFSYHYNFRYHQFVFVVWTIPSPFYRCSVSSLYTFLFRLRSVFPFYRVHRIYGVLLRMFPFEHSISIF